MRKYSKRLLALLLACIMVLACGVTAFADEIPSVTYKYPKPNTWFVTGVDGGDSYTNVIKVPCKGTLKLIADIDEDYVSGETAQTVCPQQYSLSNMASDSFVNSDHYVKNGTFFTKMVSKGDYSFETVFIAGKYKWTFTPEKTAISSVKNASSKSITVKWKKVSGVTGYQIQYSTKSDFSSKKTVTVKKDSTTSKKIKSLKKGKKYYVRVRSYTTVNGTKCYSEWSDKKAVKITK